MFHRPYSPFSKKQGAVRANVQILIALFTLCFFMFQYILSDLRPGENGRKYGFNSGIDWQIHAGITPGMLPPFGPNLTPFRPANSDVRHLNIAGFPGRIFVPHKKKKFKIFLKNE
jgi:hypothetical protein